MHKHTQTHTHTPSLGGVMLKGVSVLLLLIHAFHASLMPPAEEGRSVYVWVSVIFVITHLKER